jgi:hypothetical protein
MRDIWWASVGWLIDKGGSALISWNLKGRRSLLPSKQFKNLDTAFWIIAQLFSHLSHVTVCPTALVLKIKGNTSCCPGQVNTVEQAFTEISQNGLASPVKCITGSFLSRASNPVTLYLLSE